MKDLVFALKTARSSFTMHTVQKQKGKPVPTSRHLRETSLPVLLRQESRNTSQKQLYSNSSLKHLFLLPRWHKATTAEVLEDFASPWQGWTKLEEKVTPFIVISVYETLLTKHLQQSWQEFRVQFCGSVSSSKPYLLWDSPYQCTMLVLV